MNLSPTVNMYTDINVTVDGDANVNKHIYTKICIYNFCHTCVTHCEACYEALHD